MIYSILGFNKNIRTNMLRLTPIIYFLMFCSEITSPASDFPLVFLVIYVSIRWFEMSDENEESYIPYALLACFTVYIISIKLTVGLLVLLVIKPAYFMIRERKVKEVIASLAIGFFIILPYFIRNYLISGWLIYPFTKIDLFNPDWKISAAAAQGDADEIKIWGRGMGNISGNPDEPFKVWFPNWWNYISGPNKRIIISLIIVLCVYIAYRIVKRLYLFIAKNKDIEIIVTDHKEKWNCLVFEITIMLSMVMWFVESPLFRYGIAYILVAMFYMLGEIANSLCRHLVYVKAGYILAAVICASCLFPTAITLKEYIQWNYECVRYMSDYSYLITQEDYPRVEYEEKTIEGITFYYPKEEMGQIGYHIFPALWCSDTTNGLVLRGNEIKDGFRIIEQ